MKTYTTSLRAILLSALGAAAWACSTNSETCKSCGPGDGDSNSGDGDSGDGDMGDGDTGDGDGVTPRCTNPQQVSDSGSSVVRCDEGYYHRPPGSVCENSLPRDVTIDWPEMEMGAGGAGNVPYTTSEDECSRDTDCPELHYCLLYRTNPTPPLNSCHGSPEEVIPDYARTCQPAGSGCATDSDCESNQACVCGTYAGTCVDISNIAGCRTDEDCDGEALCLTPDFACQLPGDECSINSDCPLYDVDSGAGMECALTSEDGRICRPGPVCGRPFLVDGRARLAPSIRCSNWEEEIGRVALPSDENLRTKLAAHFTHMGLMEHASVAAFARFTLQLLSLGAPAALIEASNQALIDETRHARKCFALASAYAGDAVGPGALPLEGALENTNWEAILEATVLEGCIGETRAALEANWAAEQCADPVVRAILQQIARDETAHAELAWRAVSWMLSQRPELRILAGALFENAFDLPERSSTRPETGRAYGVLSHAELSDCWRQVQSDVIGPCALAMLSHTRSPEDAVSKLLNGAGDPATT